MHGTLQEQPEGLIHVEEMLPLQEEVQNGMESQSSNSTERGWDYPWLF